MVIKYAIEYAKNNDLHAKFMKKEDLEKLNTEQRRVQLVRMRNKMMETMYPSVASKVIIKKVEDGLLPSDTLDLLKIRKRGVMQTISEKARSLLDGNFIIPQYGMVQSLNISVACAVSLFEASRQRSVKKMYSDEFNTYSVLHNEMFDGFVQKHFEYINKKEK